MTECRKVQVVLLDDRKLTFNVQPKMYTCDLFDIVASHFNLKEKEYFGLYYLDETTNQQWLQTDRKVLDHDLPRKSDSILLYFAVRFYIENMCYLQDSVSVELYYMQARQSVYRGVVECDSTTIFELAAYALQIFQGNLMHDEHAREALKKVPVFPTSALRDHPSIIYCEDQVLKRYFAMNGIPRGQAMISYMNIVEKLPTYGVHYYEVKNKQGMQWWLGLSFKGIAQFDFTDKRTPRRVFPWKYLENLYFRDKKFSIEVHDPKRVVHTLSSFNLYEDAIREPVDECDDLSDAISDPTTQVSVSRRTFGPSNVNVYAWFTSKPQLTKCIWSMAVCQHQFFLDRLQNKTAMMVKRSPNVIADELSLPRTQSLQTMNNINSHVSLQESALNTLNMDNNNRLLQRTSQSKAELTAEQKAKQLELYKGLDEQKNKLETVLQDKIKELKALCLKESDITGDLPHEYTLFMSPGERTPTIKKRMGTAFSIAELVTGKDSDLTKLEMEYEVQKQILRAKHKLATDETLSKNVRKKHNADYTEARVKLKDLEHTLKCVRTQAGLDAGSFTSEDNTSLGSYGSSSALGKSPKKSMSSQQLEALEYSPSTRRRMNSGSRLQNSHSKSNSARSFDIPSNPSSTSSLASLSHLEGYHEFTPTKALKYNRPVIPTPASHAHMPVVHSSADLKSYGSSTPNSSTSSLHAYSVSNGRPLRSGSMDDVRLAGNTSGNASSPHATLHNPSSDRSMHNGSVSRSKTYLANNPYGSLERKALKQRRANRGGLEGPSATTPQNYNPYTPRANYGYNDNFQNRQYRPPPPIEYRQQAEEPPPIPAARAQPHPQQTPYRPILSHHYHHQHMDREYAQSVQQTSRRMYDTSQPFQLLDSQYNTQQRRSVEQLGHTLSDAHIAPIKIDSSSQLPLPPPRRSSSDTYYTDSSSTHRSSSEHYHTDSSSTQSSPQENAFSFFNTLVQLQSATNNNYAKQAPAGTALDDSRAARSQSREESKPYEMTDFYQYSERLRKARGISGPSPRPPAELPPQPAARSSGSRTPSSPAVSVEGSRSGSPYTTGYPGYSNGNRSTSSSPHTYSHLQMQPGYPGSNTLNAKPNLPRRSMAKDSSFNTGDVADNFSQEMLAWFQDKEPEQTASTLV